MLATGGRTCGTFSQSTRVAGLLPRPDCRRCRDAGHQPSAGPHPIAVQPACRGWPGVDRRSLLRTSAGTSSQATGTSSTDRAGGASSGDDGGNEYFDIVLDATAGGAAELLELNFKGRPGSAWRQVTVRPVRLKERPHLQVSWYGPKQVTAKNFECGRAAGAQLVALLSLSWQSILLRTVQRDVTIQFSKRGRPIIHSAKPAGPRLATSLSHDRTKGLPIPPGVAHPFLQKVGLQTADGRVKADMQDKMTQINELLKLLEHTGALTAPQPLASMRQLLGSSPRPAAPATGSLEDAWSLTAPATGTCEDAVRSAAPTAGGRGFPDDAVSHSDEPGSVARDPLHSDKPGSVVCSPLHSAEPGGVVRAPLHILDCGCGSSHLTFGVYHYLNHVCGIPARLSGVDTNAALMARSNERCRELGLDAEFHTGSILEHVPVVAPDLVLALHACDTATDQALALAVKQGARMVLAVPCCHQNLHQQMRGAAAVAPFGPLLQHGILKQRLGDLLTDTFRAALLRVLGYTTDCVEFVSTEHTPRNLLIRAVKRSSPLTQPQVHALLADYVALKEYWAVEPHLETLLRHELAAATAVPGSPA